MFEEGRVQEMGGMRTGVPILPGGDCPTLGSGAGDAMGGKGRWEMGGLGLCFWGWGGVGWRCAKGGVEVGGSAE